MTLPILFYTMAFSICFNGRNTLFRCWKHFVSMLETLCFNGRNTLFLWLKQTENTIP